MDLSQQQNNPLHSTARPDYERETRRGIPEVILAEGKTVEQTAAITRQFIERTGRALISRLRDEAAAEILYSLSDIELNIVKYPEARALNIMSSSYHPFKTGGHIGVISAGTSDIPVAEEACFIAEAMGCRVSRIYDVGVAGVHRLFQPLDALIADGVDAIVVAAGMDGALPSLVAGLSPAPVIGLPTPVGYGLGGQGKAALYSMLQSCSPGLTVVNIGNGIGAGSFAALIANRTAKAIADRAGYAETVLSERATPE